MSFPITCTACHKTFTISDEIYEKKVAGRVVTIKCKSCSAGIRVDGTKGSAGASAPPPAPAAAAPAAAPAVAPAAPPPPPVPEEPLWAVDYGDGQDREFTAAEIVAELKRGAITGATLIWREGMEEWLELHQVSDFAAEYQKVEAKRKADEAAKAAAAKAEAAKAAAAAKAEAAKAAAAKAAADRAAAAAAAKTAPALVHKPRAPMPTVTGLGGPKEKAGSSPELGKPKVTQPSSPDLGKPRVALGSAPDLGKPRVALGSSPELPRPRATAPSSPELPKPRATEPSGSDDLTPRPVQPAPKPQAPPAPPPPIAAPAVASATPAPQFVPPPAPIAAAPIAAAALPLPPQAMEATPPLPASVAKAVSKPPQPQAFPSAPAPLPAAPMQSFTAPAIVADHASVEWPEAKSKKPLIIGALVVVAAAVAAGVALLGGKDELPPPSPISALPPGPASPGAQPTSAPTSQPTSAAASQPGSDTASGSDPILTRDSGATPGAGFAELFAAGARKAESSGAAIAPAGRFDAAATKAPLADAATQAQACKQPGGPTGKVTVMVTFDPNGKVSGATINDAPFAGTPTATCIASALKRVSIPPFSGLPGTVSKTFSIL